MKIRKVVKADVNALKAVIDSSELFPSELLDDMMIDYFQNEQSSDIWLTVEDEGIPVAVAYCASERMTEGTYNLYLIAIHQSQQGKGIGAHIVDYLENVLLMNGQRVLIIETSGLPEFEASRKFYEKLGYTKEAVIRDFYEEGDDKVVYWKKLR